MFNIFAYRWAWNESLLQIDNGHVQNSVNDVWTFISKVADIDFA